MMLLFRWNSCLFIEHKVYKGRNSVDIVLPFILSCIQRAVSGLGNIQGILLCQALAFSDNFHFTSIACHNFVTNWYIVQCPVFDQFNYPSQLRFVWTVCLTYLYLGASSRVRKHRSVLWTTLVFPIGASCLGCHNNNLV